MEIGRKILSICLALVAGTIIVAASTGVATAQERPLCGLGTGQPATGEPILVGAIVGETGPDDFSSPADTAKAYFDCVNQNGGINGRPIEYIVEDDQWNPEVAAQAAAKLVKDIGVVALVGNGSFVEMTVNAATYEAENVLVVASACAVRECFEARNIASTNQGPLPSALGAVQWAVRNLGTKSVACIALNIPSNGGWTCDAVNTWLEQNGLESTAVLLNPAAPDLTSIILEAIASGADTMLTMLPAGAAIGILKTAEEQDLRDDYNWISPTPLYDESVPAVLGDYWDGVVYIQAELARFESNRRDAKRWRKVMEDFARPEDPRDTFSQAGFLSANIFVDTLLEMDPASINRETVTVALRAVTNYQSDLMCGPWYFGEADRHMPNHAGIMVRVVDGGFETLQGCFEVESSYLEPILAIERELGIGAN